jgi:hypothetical protein
MAPKGHSAGLRESAQFPIGVKAHYPHCRPHGGRHIGQPQAVQVPGFRFVDGEQAAPRRTAGRGSISLKNQVKGASWAAITAAAAAEPEAQLVIGA